MARHRAKVNAKRHVMSVGIPIGLVAVLACVGGGVLTVGLLDRNESPSAPAETVAEKASPAQRLVTVTVTGASCHVFASTAGNKVLFNRYAKHGESVHFDIAPLTLVLSDGGAARVFVRGRPQAIGRSGDRQQITVDR
ncbi:hypothetical protein [Actinomadura rudentiformis]|uniref:DUF4115 domain-containing protein n=1 Tax=Actinomadura rudentiformis TaxID=359158 RepID=A0A6H9Y9X1_9ACTN|nr:hypothetical protein [Actinomadura rudentiformis]KAB2339607.1 hypothetical protein F8566_47175 [Actinomadura rudentiformis]